MKLGEDQGVGSRGQSPVSSERWGLPYAGLGGAVGVAGNILRMVAVLVALLLRNRVWDAVRNIVKHNGLNF